MWRKWNNPGLKSVYQSFYEFTRDPFEPPQDAEHIFNSSTHSRALLAVLRALVNRKPLICITGRDGCGKKTVLNAAFAAMANRLHVVHASACGPQPAGLP